MLLLIGETAGDAPERDLLGWAGRSARNGASLVVPAEEPNRNPLHRTVRVKTSVARQCAACLVLVDLECRCDGIRSDDTLVLREFLKACVDDARSLGAHQIWYPFHIRPRHTKYTS
jgi:hypothetical protein